jgi:hypothetical protein
MENHDQPVSQEPLPEETTPEEKPFSIIEFFDLSRDEYDEDKVADKIQAKLGTSLLQMKEALSKSVQERAEELTLDFPNIAPLGDYGKLIEDNDGMADFLKTEGHKPEHWKLYGIYLNSVNKELISFCFWNTGVDDGKTFQGFVFTSKTGKIKHAFAQVED